MHSQIGRFSFRDGTTLFASAARLRRATGGKSATIMAGNNGKPRRFVRPGAAAPAPLIAYPCDWSYTVIGENADHLAVAIPEVLADSQPQWRPRHTSRTGRYVSFHVVVHVATEAHRDRVFSLLKSIPGVRFVL